MIFNIESILWFLILFVVLVFILLMGCACYEPKSRREAPPTIETKYKLRQIIQSKKQSSQGQFFLINGSYESHQTLTYNFYIEDNKKITLKSVDYYRVEIFEDEEIEPYVIIIKSNNASSRLPPFDTPKYILHVPSGSITQSIDLNLK